MSTEEAQKTDFELMKQFYNERGYNFETFIDKSDGETAIVWDAHGSGQYSIGHVSHAIHFDSDGEFLRMSNWDYDNDDSGFEKVKGRIDKVVGTTITITTADGKEHIISEAISISGLENKRIQINDCETTFPNDAFIYAIKFKTDEPVGTLKSESYVTQKDISDYHERKILDEPQIQMDGHVFPKSWLQDFIKGKDEMPILLLRLIALDWLEQLEGK